MAIATLFRYDATMAGKAIRKSGNPTGDAPPKDGQSVSAAERDEQMALAEAIIGEDHEMLSALAQMPVAREVMSRRRRALRDLSR